MANKSSVSILNEDDGLFNAVYVSKKNSTEVTQWVQYYKYDKIGAVAVLMNFVLMCAGAKKAWIERDVDLEALNTEEIKELLQEMIDETAESQEGMYPLQAKQKTKASVSFRGKYQSFWDRLTEQLISQGVEVGAGSNKKVNGSDILHMIIDQLVMFSCSSLVSIRDAATEAAFAMSECITNTLLELKEQRDVAQRQISAEERNKSKAAVAKNPKYQAYVKQKASAVQQIQVLSEMSSLVFTSILMHRHRDSQENIRLLCARALVHMVKFDTKASLKGEYLKYIGFLCSDHSNVVRAEAVNSVGKILEGIEGHSEEFQSFVDSFVDRFIGIAALDVDQSISVNMIANLRQMQSRGMLDQVSVEELDKVDIVIFDEEASKEMRFQALLFLFSHTEGFDDVTGDQGSSSSSGGVGSSNNTGAATKKGAAAAAAAKKKGTAAKAKDGVNVPVLARRQRAAMQIETLTEFAELHLQSSSFTDADMLAEVCLMIPGYDVLFDWPTIISLLLRDSDDDDAAGSAALRPSQVAILLSMFVSAAQHLKVKSTAAAVAAADGRLSNSKENDAWLALQDTLRVNLPLLLVRFKDDEANIAVLVNLMSCCDFSGNAKAIKAMLKVVTDIFSDVQVESVLSTVARGLHSWYGGGDPTVKNQIHSFLRADCDKRWSRIVFLTSELQAANSAAEAVGSASSSSSKRKSKGGKKNNDENDDIVYSLAHNLRVFKLIWQNFDGRQFASASESDIYDELVELCELIPQYADLKRSSAALSAAASSSSSSSTSSSSMSTASMQQLEVTCHSASRDAALVMFSMMMFRLKLDIFDVYIEAKNAGNETSDEVASALSEASDELIILREKLIDTLASWMMREQPSNTVASGSVLTPGDVDPSSPPSDLTRWLRREAFNMISDVRSMFPARTDRLVYLDRLVYRPSQEVLAGMRLVFEGEGQIMRDLLGATGGEAETPMGEEEIQHRVNSMVQFFLLPLGRTLVDDHAHLNRRQAAAIVNYLLEPSDVVQGAVKALLKVLKDADTSKYLEVQLVTLKSSYTEHVVGVMQERARAYEENDNYNEQEFDEREAVGYERTEALAKKLAPMLGVGKLKGEPLVALCNFFRAGIHFALTDVAHVGFVGILAHYLRFLPPAELKGVYTYVDRTMAAPIASAVAAEYEIEQDSSEPSHDFELLFNFIDTLLGRGGKAARAVAAAAVSTVASKKRGGVRGREIAEEPSYSRSPAAPAAAAKSASKKRAAQRSTRYENEDEDDDDSEEKNGGEEEEVEGIDSSSSSSQGQSQSGRTSSRISQISPTKKARSSGASASASAQFSYGLDIQDDDDEIENDEEEEEEESKAAISSQRTGNSRGSSRGTSKSARSSSAAAVSSSSAASSSSRRSGNTSGSTRTASLADLDAVPSTRSKYR